METLKIRRSGGMYWLYEYGKRISDPYKKRADIENLWLEFHNHRSMERYLEKKIFTLVDETSAQFSLSKALVRDTIEWLAEKAASSSR